MAQTRKKRQTKHRGNAAGVVEARGRTGRPPSPEVKKRQAKEAAKLQRLSKPPQWKTSIRNSAIMGVFIFIFLLFTDKAKHGSAAPAAVVVALLAFAVYVPAGYYMERYMWKRRMRSVTNK